MDASLNDRETSAAPDGGNISTNNDSSANANSERVLDGDTEWLPVHVIVPRLNGALWSHFLGCDPELRHVRCKHCGKVIDRVNPESHRLANKLLVSHLKVHGVNPTDDYYPRAGATTGEQSSRGTTSQEEADEGTSDSDSDADSDHRLDSHLEPRSESQGVPPTVPQLDLEFQRSELPGQSPAGQDDELEEEEEETPEEQSHVPRMELPTTQLLAIIVASQNLPLSFVHDSSMRMLLGRVSDTYSVDSSDVLAAIKRIARQISSVIERTAARNNVDMQMIVTDSENDMHTRLSQHLKTLKNTTFFGMTNYVWGHATSVLALQFYDPRSGTVKSMPLAVDRSRTENDFEVATLHGQLLQAFKTSPSLHRSVLSVTLPRERRASVAGLEDNDWFANIKTPMSNYHPCVASLLIEMLSPLFGKQDIEGIRALNYKEKLRERCRRNERAPGAPSFDGDIDKIVCLDDINPSGTIFDKINTFYDEVYSNPWELSRFDQTVAKLLRDDPVPMVYFDPSHYSTAQTCLENFLALKDVIEETQAHTRTTFTNVDYLIVKYELELIRSTNRLLLYFASSKPLSLIFAIPGIVAIEKHINATLQTVQLQRLWKPLKRVLSNISMLRDSLITDNMILVAMFLCPSALFEREVLEYAFRTVSLSEIVDMVSEKVQGVVKRFVCVQEVDAAPGDLPGEHFDSRVVENDGEDSVVEDIDGEEDVYGPRAKRQHRSPENNHSMHSLRTNNLTLQREADAILLQYTQEDLYNYLSTVNSVVPLSYASFCEHAEIIRENGLFKRQVQVPVSEEESGFKEESINYIDQLLDIHIPVCEAFWQEYLGAGAGTVLQIVINMVRAQAASAIRLEYGFLRGYVPALGEDRLEDAVRIKLFSEQFVAGKVDFDIDTLPSACTYT